MTPRQSIARSPLLEETHPECSTPSPTTQHSAPQDKGDYSISNASSKGVTTIRRWTFGNYSRNRYLIGVSKSRKLQIQKEARTALLGDIVNFPISEMGDVFGNPDLGDEYRSS